MKWRYFRSDEAYLYRTNKNITQGLNSYGVWCDSLINIDYILDSCRFKEITEKEMFLEML